MVDIFDFPDTQDIIKDRLKSCHPCQMHKAKLDKSRGLFSPQQANALFKCLSMDVIELTARTEEGIRIFL